MIQHGVCARNPDCYYRALAVASGRDSMQPDRYQCHWLCQLTVVVINVAALDPAAVSEIPHAVKVINNGVDIYDASMRVKDKGDDTFEILLSRAYACQLLAPSILSCHSCYFAWLSDSAATMI